jgi:ATP-dependent helicase/nuclease subunit A
MSDDQSSILSLFNLKSHQRQAAQQHTAIDEPSAISVTAGAGSGKTRTLVGRYLRLLESGHPIRSLIAITFTDKAAREMRSRIRAEIENWLASHNSNGEGEEARLNQGHNWQNIFSELDAARIGTIHSLCAEILRTHPAEAGVDPDFTVMEEGMAAAIKVQAVKASLNWAANDPLTAQLFGILKEREIRQIMSILLHQRLDIDPMTNLQPTLNRWSADIETWFVTRLNDPVWTGSLDVLASYQASQPDDILELARQDVITSWDEVENALQDRDWNATILKLTQLRKMISTRGRKDNWDPEDLGSVREAMRSLRDHFDTELKPLIGGKVPPRWTQDEKAAGLLPSFSTLWDQVLREYQKLKDEQQALDFDDLEGKAAHLLCDNPNVRKRWQRETRVVLVDEFQDTNDRQRQIIYALTGFEPSRHTKQQQTLEISSSLFIVGDAKQSIYKFRGADVTVFRKVQADIEGAGGLSLDLDLTFRAHKSLLTILNATLAPILGETENPDQPYQVPFAPLRAYRKSPKSETIGAPFVELQLGLGVNAETGRRSAAGALAERLLELNAAKEFEWGEMALLFRASTAFEVYEDALERAGIPFVTVAGRGFYDRPEIRDVLNALAAVADPSDDLALAGLLRSPAIGFTDAALYHLRFLNGSSRATPLWEALNAETENASSVLQHAVNIISELHALVGRSSAAEVLKRFLDLTSYRMILGMVPGGSRLQRNVDKLLADAHRSRLVSLVDFLAYVQTLRDVGTREGEAPVEAEGAVQLMTVHKAKGLEFPMVVIADAAYKPPVWRSGVLLDEDMGLLLGIRDADGARPLAWKLAGLTDAAKEEAEDKRLLYVAATRAQEKLLVNGHVKVLKGGKLSLQGWVGRIGEVIGLDEVEITEEVNVRQSLDVFSPTDDESISCVLYPEREITPDFSEFLDEQSMKPSEGREAPDLAAPLQIPELEFIDEKTRLKTVDPPQRVWRVVPKAKRPSGPAWVVGQLVHEALRHWRFPDDGDFETFITPFALEAGLTDPREIQGTIRDVSRLLTRFRGHPLFKEIEAAERYHEVPYVYPGDRGIIDILYRAGDSWVIADFKTDEVRTETDIPEIIQRGGYDKQVRRYVDVVTTQLGKRPRGLLVFLQVGHGAIAIVEIEHLSTQD